MLDRYSGRFTASLTRPVSGCCLLSEIGRMPLLLPANPDLKCDVYRSRFATRICKGVGRQDAEKRTLEPPGGENRV